MKRLLVVLLCFLLVGCSYTKEERPASFYYVPADYIHALSGSMLESEIRETVHLQTTQEILQHYLEGPENPRFHNPFPTGCRLIAYDLKEGTATVVISKELAQLSGTDLPLACAALAMTCSDLTGAEAVRIRTQFATLAGKQEVFLTRDMLLLLLDPDSVFNSQYNE